MRSEGRRWECGGSSFGTGCVKLLPRPWPRGRRLHRHVLSGTGGGEACAGVGMVVLKTRVSEGCMTTRRAWGISWRETCLIYGC